VRRSAGLLVAAVAIGMVVTACGSSGSSKAASQDATAACQALSRSQKQLSSLTLSVGYRLTGASGLGVAAAGEDNHKYGNLSEPMKTVANDVSSNASGAIANDVKVALAVCKMDKLPS
jgi:hypothetical protein